jgi:hypothetical protein
MDYDLSADIISSAGTTENPKQDSIIKQVEIFGFN